MCTTRVRSEPLISGARYRIPDGSFSAESYDTIGVGYSPPEARLTGNTWCSAVGSAANTWLQITLPSEMVINYFRTVGYPGIIPRWYVTSYQLLIGNDTGNLQAIKQTGSMEPMVIIIVYNVHYDIYYCMQWNLSIMVILGTGLSARPL